MQVLGLKGIGKTGVGIFIAVSPSGLPIPPTGFVFLVEVENGVTYYLTDSAGNYLVERI